MALGGGTFLTQNKILPGSYINFVNASRASAALSDRGVAAMALELDWGPDGELFEVTPGDLQKDSLKLFGCPYTDMSLKGIRDLFLHIRKAYLYRLNSGEKAANDLAEARYSGVKGNELTIVISANVDDETCFDVKTLFAGKEVDRQTVKTATELKSNDYLAWKSGGTLAATAGTPLAGGTNKAAVTGEDYQSFLDKLEPCSFHTLGCISDEASVKGLFVSFTKRMRDECGVKFQTVLYRPQAPDYEGIIAVENQTKDKDWPETSAVYWTTGAQAGCTVNKSLTNAIYRGEFEIDAAYKQAQLEAALKAGKFLFHQVGGEIRALEDVNSFTGVTEEKSADFSGNQTIRVLDQIGNDIAALFNANYLGKVPNDNAGRISLWNDIVKHHQDLEKIRAIENFAAEDVAVEAGDSKKAVVVIDHVTPVSAMTQLYMTVIVE